MATRPIESDFETAVLRFSDDTFDVIGANAATQSPVPLKAQKLAGELNDRLLKETGVNFSARLLVSILNAQEPGVFLAQFDQGKRGRFNLLLDHQGRVSVQTFDLNAGEKGLLFSTRSPGSLG